MTSKRILFILSFIGLGYFGLFIAPNMTGAKDINMLAVFEADEFAMAPHILRMVTPGATFYQTIRNLTVFLHYYYGYPFYLFTALVTFPIKWVCGDTWLSQIQFIVLTWRQIVSVLPMICAMIFLVFMQTRFRSLWKSVALFILLLNVPALFSNNFWWHPESLLTLFIITTFYFLDRDALRFGKNFILAAISCGLATGTKHLGVFFVLVIPVYLFWGWHEKYISIRRSLFLAGQFLVLMLATVIIINPLLLLPQERAEIITTQMRFFQENSTGFYTINTQSFFENSGLPQDFRTHYGEIWFVLCLVGGIVLGMRNPRRRRLYWMIVLFSLPFCYYFIFIATTRRTHYLMPPMLLLISCLIGYMDLIPQVIASKRSKMVLSLLGIIAGLVLYQTILFLQTNINNFNTILQREQRSPSITFYNGFSQTVLSPHTSEESISLYHDWHVYLPPNPKWRIEMRWELATYPYISEIKPRYILLEKENVALFSQSETLDKAINPGNLLQTTQFYADASKRAIDKYKLVYEDQFGMVFEKEK